MNDSSGTSRRAGSRMTLLGILTLVLAVLVLAAPALMGLSLLWLVGLMVAVAGTFRMFWSFKAEDMKGGVVSFAIGGLTLLGGLVILGSPLLASGVLSVLLAVYFVVDGLAEVSAAFALRPVGGWGWVLFGGVVSIVLGILIWRQFPLSGIWAIGVFMGIKLAFSGIMMLTLGAGARAMERAMEG
jgi:uncharacterized membrane protein HdeD (DUF308 family)